jgi:type IV secretory pathway TrbL component
MSLLLTLFLETLVFTFIYIYIEIDCTMTCRRASALLVMIYIYIYIYICSVIKGESETFYTQKFNVKMEVKYEGVSKSFRTGRLERELQMVQLSATRCRCIAIL